MDSGSASIVIMVGAAGLIIISLVLWGGHVLLNWIGHEPSTVFQTGSSINNQSGHEKPAKLQVPDGQERLATQLERDDVNGTIQQRDLTPAGRPVQL